MSPIERPHDTKGGLEGGVSVDADEIESSCGQLSREEIDALIEDFRGKTLARVAVQRELWDRMRRATDTATLDDIAKEMGKNATKIGNYHRSILRLLQTIDPDINPHTYPGTK